MAGGYDDRDRADYWTAMQRQFGARPLTDPIGRQIMLPTHK
jgi:hypothetical protein